MAKLFPLEVSAACETNATNGDDNVDQQDNDDQDKSPAVRERLTRNAAIRARDRIKELSNILFVAPEDVPTCSLLIIILCMY